MSTPVPGDAASQLRASYTGVHHQAIDYSPDSHDHPDRLRRIHDNEVLRALSAIGRPVTAGELTWHGSLRALGAPITATDRDAALDRLVQSGRVRQQRQLLTHYTNQGLPYQRAHTVYSLAGPEALDRRAGS